MRRKQLSGFAWRNATERERASKCTEPLSQEIKDVLENYLDTINNLEAKRSEYLYVQGAKDCVLLLQKLGVIR